MWYVHVLLEVGMSVFTLSAKQKNPGDPVISIMDDFISGEGGESAFVSACWSRSRSRSSALGWSLVSV